MYDYIVKRCFSCVSAVGLMLAILSVASVASAVEVYPIHVKRVKVISDGSVHINFTNAICNSQTWGQVDSNYAGRDGMLSTALAALLSGHNVCATVSVGSGTNCKVTKLEMCTDDCS